MGHSTLVVATGDGEATGGGAVGWHMWLLRVRLVVSGAMVALVAGCSSSAPLTRSGPSSTGPAAVSTTAAPATSSPATSPTRGQKVTVTPASGLTSGQTVQVDASGFSPGEALVVTECAAKGAATSASDCDLADIQSVTADTAGDLTTQFTVTKGPFGANNVVCGPAQPCLISVTQATPSPTQEADTRISFV